MSASQKRPSVRFGVTACLVFAATLLVVACGGGGDDPPPAGPTVAERSAAATATAQSASNACAAIRPFYWEIGDGTATLVAGSVLSSTDPTVYTANTAMAIASASKWVYSTYLLEKRAGTPTAADVKFLTFRSGYTQFLSCLAGQTVQQCVDFASNGNYVAGDDGRFAYGGGHMQKHAADDGLGPLDNAGLAAEIAGRLGGGIAIGFSQPQPAGGMQTTAADYARLLRRIVAGNLRMQGALGTHAVCTNPATCSSAESAPIPASESWHYSLGHWVEDDPVIGDGAFSSAGAFGFYPWIDAGKTSYGVVARAVGAGAFDSVQCGRTIRKAWATAIAQ